MNYFRLLFLLLSLVAGTLIYAQPPADSLVKPIGNVAPPGDTITSSAPSEILVDTTIRLPKLEFNDSPLREALTALARSYNLSLYVDSTVTGTITLRLDNVRLNDALRFIFDRYDLTYERVGQIIRIFKPQPPPPALPPLELVYENGMLSCDLQQVDLERLTHDLAEITGHNIVLAKGLRGSVSGKLTNLPFDRALSTLMSANGFATSTNDGIWYVLSDTTRSFSGQSRRLNIRCDSGQVTLDFREVPLSEAISALGSQCQVNIVIQGPLSGTVSLNATATPVEQVLLGMLITTPYTVKRVKNDFYVGPRESEALFESRLLQLRYETVAAVEPLLPATLTKNVTVKRVPEHNGLLLTGPRTTLEQIEQFVQNVDIPVAQVLFEVLVIDYSTTDHTEFSLIANNFGGDSGLPGETYYPQVDINRTGALLNRDLNSLSRDLGISNLGTLPESFFARLRILVREGKANVRSQPQIATLNGHTASIKIGTTQYYLLKSETIYPSTQTNLTTQTTQRFEKIEADLSLEVTPFVSRDGFLTVDVNPVFNSPVGAFDPDVPPTINRRELNSTVRLHNGETIVLGGLVEQTRVAGVDKFPLLGSLPLLGRLFQNRTSTDRSSTLMIYITPRVYFGSEGSVSQDSLPKLK